MSTRSGYNITDQNAPYFVTFTAVGWVDIFSRKACKDIIIDALQYYNQPKILYSPNFTWQKIHYIHNNPVKAGIVDQTDAYRYSSARNYKARTDAVMPVTIIDFGISEGYVSMD